MEDTSGNIVDDVSLANAIMGLVESMTNIDASYRRRETFLLRAAAVITGILLLVMIILSICIVRQNGLNAASLERSLSLRLDHRIEESDHRTEEIIKTMSINQTVTIESDLKNLARKIWEQDRRDKREAE